MRDLLEGLILREEELKNKKVLAGFDGFVDTIARPILVSGAADRETVYFKTIKEFGSYIADHSHKSASIDMDILEQRRGGNMPNFAGGLAALGLSPWCIGMLSDAQGNIDPIFKDLPGKKISFAPAGSATAMEFEDGKIFLAPRLVLPEDPWPIIEKSLDRNLLAEADLIACLNWSELSFTTKLWQDLLTKCRTICRKDKTKYVFFDLSDFHRKTETEVRTILSVIAGFSAFRATILSLNKNEAAMLGDYLAKEKNASLALDEIAAVIRKNYPIDEIIIHSHHSSLVYAEQICVTGETDHISAPKISTGAGDHFNAAYAFATLGHLPIGEKIRFANYSAAAYISSGKSPTLKDLSGDFCTANNPSG